MAGRCCIADAPEGFAAVKTKVIDWTIFIPSYIIIIYYVLANRDVYVTTTEVLLLLLLFAVFVYTATTYPAQS